MIDTIKIGWHLEEPPSPEGLEERGWRPRYHIATGQVTSLSLMDKNLPGSPLISMFTAQNGHMYVSAGVSLPRFVNGSNFPLLSPNEVVGGLESLSNVTSEATFSRCALQDARVWNVDFAVDINVAPSRIRETIDLASQMSIKGFRRSRYAETSVYFHKNVRGRDSKFRTICIYSKQDERAAKRAVVEHMHSAEGVVRIEARYRNPSVVKTLAKSVGLQSSDVPELLSESVALTILEPLQRHLRQLRSNAEQGDQIAILRERYGARKTDNLVSHLHHKLRYGEDYYKNPDFGRGKNAYYRLEKELREAGVASLGTNVFLQPLRAAFIK